MLDIFHTLAEVAVAVAGFSSLIIIFRGDSAEWTRLDYIHFAFVLSWSIGSIFLALLPILLVQFGWTLAAASRIGLIVWIVYFVTVGGLLMQARRRAHQALGERPKANWVLNTLFTVVTIGSGAAAAGVLPGPVDAWYAFAISFLMIGSIANLAEIVFRSMTRSG